MSDDNFKAAIEGILNTKYWISIIILVIVLSGCNQPVNQPVNKPAAVDVDLVGAQSVKVKGSYLLRLYEWDSAFAENVSPDEREKVLTSLRRLSEDRDILLLNWYVHAPSEIKILERNATRQFTEDPEKGDSQSLD